MPAKHHKRKTVKHSGHDKKISASPSLLARYPRLGLLMGFLLLFTAALLLSIGHVGEARIGLAMISLFFGIALVFMSKTRLPKKR